MNKGLDKKKKNRTYKRNLVMQRRSPQIYKAYSQTDRSLNSFIMANEKQFNTDLIRRDWETSLITADIVNSQQPRYLSSRVSGIMI